MVSHGVGQSLDGLGPGAMGASVGDFAVFGLGHGASRAVGRCLDLGRAGTPVFDGTDMPRSLARGFWHRSIAL